MREVRQGGADSRGVRMAAIEPLVVDLDPPAPSITVYGLGAPDDGYVESQTATGELVVVEPFEMRIDIGALVEQRSHRSEG